MGETEGVVEEEVIEDKYEHKGPTPISQDPHAKAKILTNEDFIVICKQLDELCKTPETSLASDIKNNKMRLENFIR